MIFYLLYSPVCPQILGTSLANLADECLAVNKVLRADLEALSPNTPAERVPQNIKCYAKCLLRDYIGQNNKFDMLRVGDNANAEEKPVMARCVQQFDSVSTSSPSDYGYLILQCLTLASSPTKTGN